MEERNKQTNKQTNKQRQKQTNKQRQKQTNKQIWKDADTSHTCRRGADIWDAYWVDKKAWVRDGLET